MSPVVNKIDGRSARSEATKVRILEAAVSCYQSAGIGKTTVDDIILKSGLARATLYRHFASIDELLIAVLKRDQGDIVDHLQSLYDQHNDCVEFMVAALTYLIYDCRSRSMTVLLFDSQSVGVLNQKKIWSDLNNQADIHIMDNLYKQSRKSGLLRKHFNKAMFTEWIWRFTTSYLSNPGEHLKSRKATTAFIRNVFIPSIYTV